MSFSSASSTDLSQTSNFKQSDLHHYKFTYNSRPSAASPSSPSTLSPHDHIKIQSVKKPEVLIGWRIEVPEFGRGVVLDYEKKKFRSTKYRVLFDDAKERLLKLKRSEKKGKIPFTLLEITGK
jgi:hypothetical protein